MRTLDALTPTAFEVLLAYLDTQPETAALEYERLRAKLSAFFDWSGLADAEIAVDETLDRVASHLAQGRPIGNLRKYVYGVARLVLQERRRLQSRQDSGPCPPGPDTRDGADVERRAQCLDRCLAALPAQARDLVLDYYRDEANIGGAERHQAQARRLGMSPAALRVTVYRTRMALEACIERCLSELPEEP